VSFAAITLRVASQRVFPVTFETGVIVIVAILISDTR